MRRARVIFAFLLPALLLTAAAFAVEPTSAPSNLIVDAHTSLRNESAADPLGPSRVAWSLALVLGIIIALRLLAKWYLPGSAGRAGSGAVQVLLRQPIAPRQQVVIMKVGARLLVIGDSGQQMNTLCEITDPDEIAAMLSQIPTQTPHSIFSSKKTKLEDPPNPDLATTRAELNGLLSKVQTMSKNFRPN